MRPPFELKETFPVEASKLYLAWLDSPTHSAMTGGQAVISDQQGDDFTAWDGYIQGKNLSLVQEREIVQSWRTLDFKDEDSDSELTLKFRDTDKGCELTLIHAKIPEGQPDYKQGWYDHYFNPMRSYFGDQV